jgi:hypothetical protein
MASSQTTLSSPCRYRTPVGTQKANSEFAVSLDESPGTIAAFNNLPIKNMREMTAVPVVHVDGKSTVLLAALCSVSRMIGSKPLPA